MSADGLRRPRLGVREGRGAARHEAEELERVAPDGDLEVRRQALLGEGAGGGARRRPDGEAGRRDGASRRLGLHQGAQQTRLPGRARLFQTCRLLARHARRDGEAQQADHLAAGGRQPHRPLLRHNAFLTQLCQRRADLGLPQGLRQFRRLRLPAQGRQRRRRVPLRDGAGPFQAASSQSSARRSVVLICDAMISGAISRTASRRSHSVCAATHRANS